MRKISVAALLLFTSFHLSGCNQSDLLVGTWQGANQDGDKWTVIRRADRTFTLTMVANGNNVTAEGVYSIIASTHRYYYTSSTDPSWQIRHQWKERVLRLTPTEFLTEDKKDGIKSIERKVAK